MTVVAVIAQGEMGAGLGRRLSETGARVLTSLQGRSPASAERARAAKMEPVEDDQRLVDAADFVLSVVPPGDAAALARRLAPVLAAAGNKPVYIEANAISPRRTAAVAAILAPTGAPVVDGGIIGPPPKPGTAGPRLYVSGSAAPRVESLRAHGLDIRVLEGGIGTASALKLAYASLTKGTVAIGAATMLGAMRGGVAPALRAELAASQSTMAARIAQEVPRMYPKAYRWVAEMEEIADFLAASPGARKIYEGAAELYAELAQADGAAVALIDRFLER